jgi:putative tryptophan/tyrosine transport system substrate-binding protein
LHTEPQAAARVLGPQLHVVLASTELDFLTVFATLVQLRAGGLLIRRTGASTCCPHDLSVSRVRCGRRLNELRENSSDLERQVGIYTGRILKGEKPADLPVQQSTRIQLIINMKTAKAWGLTFPLTIIDRADEVIE